MKRLASFFVIGGFLISCQEAKSPSEVVARQFMDAYYVKADLSAATGFADGFALEKVKTSLRLVEGQVKDDSTHQPKISYTLLESRRNGKEANYLFLVSFQPSMMPRIQKKTLLKLREREGGVWRVTQFSDHEMERESL